MNLNKVNQVAENKFRFLERIVPESKKKELEKNLRHKEIDPERYINLFLGTSLTSSALLTGFMLTKSPVNALGLGLIVFSVLYLLSMKLPRIMRRKYNNKLEKSMARSLRTISTELKIKSSFSSCIERAVNQETPAGREFRRVKRDLERGASYPEALSRMGERNSSRFIKRTAKQLVSAYSEDPEEGSRALKKLAEEQESILRKEMEEYNQKLLVYSLIFIATSAVIPAMFQALIIIGSNFLQLNITPLQALLIPMIGFPALNIGIFLYITSKKP